MGTRLKAKLRLIIQTNKCETYSYVIFHIKYCLYIYIYVCVCSAFVGLDNNLHKMHGKYIKKTNVLRKLKT